MTAYYNENDPEAVAVLHELITAGVIAPGHVDSRSIKEVTPNDIAGYTQCHFFAGAGLWSVGARLAGFPDDRPVWSASCPCQGESLAGKRLGADDPRHLWPDLYRLIRSARPPIIVGEQVAAAAGTHWLDGMCADLEVEDYSARAVDIPACAIDAPHQRNRLYWIAVGDAISSRLEGQRGHGHDGAGWAQPYRSASPADGRNGSWFADAEWIQCHDEKARRAKPGTPMLVDGMVGRGSVWRLAGNGILPQLAEAVFASILDVEAGGDRGGQ